MEFFEILCGIAIIFISFYYYSTSTFNFWNLRGVRGPQPIPIFGNVKDFLFEKKGIGHYLMEVYKNYEDESMIGIFIKKTPVLIVKDLDLIKNVLIKDFNSFADRGFTTHEKV